MAENKEDRSKEDLTEDASPYRLEENRKKGIVSQSKEVSGIAVLFACGVTAYVMSPSLGTQLMEFMREVFRTDLSSRVELGSPEVAKGYFLKALHIIASIGIPVSGAGFIVGVLGSFVQIGSIFSVEPLMPDFSKLNPLSGLQRMFSAKHAIEGVRLVFKMIVVLAVAYFLVKTEILQSPSHIGEGPEYLLSAYGRAAKGIFLTLVGVLTVFAGIDFGFQKYEFNKSMRMTKQEAKQEHKERDGDPHTRARIRSIQREMARKRMMQAVKKADVIITNPTHIAVALIYKGTMGAPKVVAKGADLIAQKIKEIGAEAGIPLVENVPLARALYKSVKVGQNIPRSLYQAVAEVLAYVYRLRKRNL